MWRQNSWDELCKHAGQHTNICKKSPPFIYRALPLYRRQIVPVHVYAHLVTASTSNSRSASDHRLSLPLDLLDIGTTQIATIPSPSGQPCLQSQPPTQTKRQASLVPCLAGPALPTTLARPEPVHPVSDPVPKLTLESRVPAAELISGSQQMFPVSGQWDCPHSASDKYPLLIGQEGTAAAHPEQGNRCPLLEPDLGEKLAGERLVAGP
ncbi:uncharacterized protein LOC122872936 [Siniperca chuatsi]|uniref:uncharacterized protein LOC122872936 n=1 Tax=Siniperca chuatsi TaxID=119488 RepID=UPI001CE14FBF|nr:uncharacterized protein LOC122872936 [Siniperca chuatsi]